MNLHIAHTKEQTHIEIRDKLEFRVRITAPVKDHTLLILQYVAPGCTPSLPPSTTWIVPEQYAPASDAKYKTVPAISSSLPARPSGCMVFGSAPSTVMSSLPKTACIISEGKTGNISNIYVSEVSITATMKHARFGSCLTCLAGYYIVYLLPCPASGAVWAMLDLRNFDKTEKDGLRMFVGIF